MTIGIGERVAGKYELRRLLGTGAMGSVYEAVHTDLGKRVAIKLTHHELGESPEVEARFRREARAVSAVESDYIVQIFDFGRDPRLGLYMVIEYLEGEDLAARLARERWISDRDTAILGVQIGRGLARAHAAGIVHRDLKPANVFLTRGDDGAPQAKLLDFGISKVERGEGPASRGDPTLTSVGATVGTPQYMSPEQCEGKTLDGRADVWALAAVLYEMIAGEPAISEVGGQLAVMLRILRDDLPPLARRASWVNPELAAVIDAGLVRDRNRRIPDAATFVARLLSAMPDAGAAPPQGLGETEHRTDVSELAPSSDPEPTQAVERLPVTKLPLGPIGDPRIADTGNPTSATPPSSDVPSSASEDIVKVFSRGEMPTELAKLRKKKRS